MDEDTDFFLTRDVFPMCCYFFTRDVLPVCCYFFTRDALPVCCEAELIKQSRPFTSKITERKKIAYAMNLIELPLLSYTLAVGRSNLPKCPRSWDLKYYSIYNFRKQLVRNNELRIVDIHPSYTDSRHD